MKRSEYYTILRFIEDQEFDFNDTLQKLKLEFPEVRFESLRSILTQEYQKCVKNRYPAQTCDRKRKEIHRLFFERYRSDRVQSGEGIIFDLAKANKFSPALTARTLLSELYDGEDEFRIKVNQLLKDSNLIDEGSLAVEVWRATLHDENCGVLSECIKSAVGLEYERRLQRNLRDLGVAFYDECELRKRGLDKTPDFKLIVPITVKDCVVNWIESKALFGDYDNHVSYMNNQLLPYWSRFGPGMVIYWFGYVEDAEWSVEKGILVQESFPDRSDIVFMDPLNDYVTRPLSSSESEVESEEESVAVGLPSVYGETEDKRRRKKKEDLNPSEMSIIEKSLRESRITDN